jgi:3-oxoacyl-[acyl-carrier protein] reductase
MFDLSGRVALVTGAGQNVGAGIARALAAHGAAVAVNDLVRDRAAEVAADLTAAGARAAAAPFDVTDAAAAQSGIAAAVAELGPIDILVNNAGVPEGMGTERFREMDPGGWARFIDLNLYGVLHCSHAVVGGMCERGWGRLLTVSSTAGQVGVPFGVSLYGAGKGGALAFMRHLALEVARDGVTANAIALGLMDNVGDPAFVAAVAPSIPVGRLGSADDAAAAAVFLVSDEASWITGQTLGVNGGSVTG